MTSIRSCLAVLLGIIALPASEKAGEVPANLGLGLGRLVQTHQQNRAQFSAQSAASKTAQVDAAERVVVNIHLDGKRSADEVSENLRQLGLEIIAMNSRWRNGVVSARLPIDRATAVAKMPGVRSVMLAPRPRRRVGRVTAQSSVVERAWQVNRPGFFTPQGFIGRGTSVGIISDSFNTATAAPRAVWGVNSGDLPGPGNPNGYNQPVVVLNDDADPESSDEGRGMAEIVHDIAPAAKLCFAAAGPTQTSMAQSIRVLRTDPSALCDVIVDDIYYFDEPFFSDGQLSQAVDDVATSSTLPGKKVVFLSASGNGGNYGYVSDARLLTPAQARAAQGPVHLTATPQFYYAGGVHNFGSSATHPVIAMPVRTDPFGSVILVLQWGDLFDAGAVTTDYNLLLYNASGVNVMGLGGLDDNVATDEPIEIIDFLEPATDYYVVIALASPRPPTARRLQLLSIDGTPIAGPYISYNAPTVFGHPVAANAGAVGAYFYNTIADRNPTYNVAGGNPPPGPYLPALEFFNSNGGRLPIYFNAQGQRLFTPIIRLKPDFSAVDGVDTTFFPSGQFQDYDNNGFPNFFGTSASAPTAAGIAALMLEAAGGPGSISQAQVRAKLQQTAFPHDLDPFYCEAIARAGQTVVKVAARGNDSAQSVTDPRAFTVTFAGSGTLNQLQIDLTNAGLAFDSSPSTGFPFTRGPSNPANISISPSISANRKVLTLNFANSFRSGQMISFGIDRDFPSGFFGDSADVLAGATVVATLTSGLKIPGGFANRIGRGFSLADGYGLIDAQGAVESIVGKHSTPTGVPKNISTRAFVGTGNEVLIGGFIIQDAPKKVVLRGIGPSLTAHGVPAVLADPVLQLHNANGTLIAINDNWRDSATHASQIYNAGLAPSNNRESALIRTLPVSNYTAILRGAQGTTGNALVEIYDIDQAAVTARLGNVSSRGSVKSGDSIMIGGIIVGGTAPANVVVRALGPSLAAAGVSGALSDPVLELRDGNGSLIRTNDNWQEYTNKPEQIFSDGLAPVNGLESAISLSLNAGNYTAIVRGARGSTGIGLVEMYSLR